MHKLYVFGPKVQKVCRFKIYYHYYLYNMTSIFYDFNMSAKPNCILFYLNKINFYGSCLDQLKEEKPSFVPNNIIFYDPFKVNI